MCHSKLDFDVVEYCEQPRLVMLVEAQQAGAC